MRFRRFVAQKNARIAKVFRAYDFRYNYNSSAIGQFNLIVWTVFSKNTTII